MLSESLPIINPYCMRAKRDVNKRYMIENHKYENDRECIGWILCISCICLNKVWKLKIENYTMA